MSFTEKVNREDNPLFNSSPLYLRVENAFFVTTTITNLKKYEQTAPIST